MNENKVIKPFTFGQLKEFIISIELKEEKLSESKMVRYEATHFSEIENVLNAN